MENYIAIFKEKLEEPRNLAIAVGILGFLIGLLFAYVLFPIQWTDASAENLRPDLRVDYLRNAITTYTLTGDRGKALQAFAELGEKSEETLTELAANPGFLNTEQIERFSKAINTTLPGEDTSVVQAPETVLEDGTQIVVEGEEPHAEAETESNSLLWLGFGLLGVLVLGAAAAYWFYFKERGFNFGKTNQEITSEHKIAQAVRRPAAAAVTEKPVVEEAPAPKPAAERVSIFANGNNKASNGKVNGNGNGKANGNGNGNGNKDKPVAQFMSTYMFGDDRYDESFTFDAPNGAFLGECGISISDLIGVGEPKKISAFDIWLFDKNDIQTVTKVIMSKHAYNDADIRQRLEIRGEPILAEPGKLFRLETATLRMEGRIVDVSYGDLPLPEDSYFQRNTVELAVYRK